MLQTGYMGCPLFDRAPIDVPDAAYTEERNPERTWAPMKRGR